MRRELFHVRYIEVCQSRCQGRRESFARLIQNVDGRNPHISFQFMIKIQVIAIGEVRVSLKRSPLGDATWGRFFSWRNPRARSTRTTKRAQRNRNHTKKIFALRKTAKFKSNRRENKEIVERVVACRRARRLWSERCSKWSAGRTRVGGEWQNGRISVVQSRPPAHQRREQREAENDARLVYSDNIPL
ncbi:uncharacterized protein P174DRAFT_44912 [Aspergillus novofumigatus IBT 16806]|uniref:Uncharacterized protein n=1 Tax=Aspergillus novofumigatus (strain IBT 16806) TaxID=1392255 RepID=A0A2I1CNY0_ASPN1|nr:uncharacterized protein P174DRAFT_44912 [Aspergillus novofumigatus IBT 16806]PKX99306.1 hypothetical protein P174DRAFT_44912 [Aspergillus novofumigatus IBT 16806]